MTRRTYLLGMCLWSAACVDAGAKPPLGNAEFASGVALSSADYAQAAPRTTSVGSGATSNAAASAPTVPVGAAGMNALPPTAAVPGAAGAAPMASGPAGRGSAELAGRGAAGGGQVAGRGAAGMPASAAGAPAAAPSGTAGKLTVDFKSVALGGRYAPRNVGAVWIETSSGMFVKTLERWAGIRSVHLSRWTMASGGWGSLFGGGNTADMMDAVSRATLRSHEVHHAMWDMQDASGKTVPDGKYNLMIEVADDNFAASTSGSVAFEKGPAPQTVMAPDKSPYSGLVIVYQP